MIAESFESVPPTALRPPGSDYVWISVEGLNGVGKSTAIRAVAAAWGPRCLRLDELTDKTGDTLPARIVSALQVKNDPFLRTGNPVAETFALLALKVREFEQLSETDMSAVDVVLEDRGLDTVAVYQAAIMSQRIGADGNMTELLDLALRIAATGSDWRPTPDATILLRGDREIATARFAARIGVTLSEVELDLIARAERLYDALAATAPGRFTVLDVAEHTPEQIAAELHDVCRDLVESRRTLR